MAALLAVIALFELACVAAMHPLAAPHVPAFAHAAMIVLQPAMLLAVTIACERAKVKPGWNGAGVPAMLALGWSWSFGLVVITERLGLPVFPVDLAPNGEATPPHWYLMFAVGGVLLFWMAASGLYGPVLRPLARALAPRPALAIGAIVLVAVPLGVGILFLLGLPALIAACESLTSWAEETASGQHAFVFAAVTTLVPIALHLALEARPSKDAHPSEND